MYVYIFLFFYKNGGGSPRPSGVPFPAYQRVLSIVIISEAAPSIVPTFRRTAKYQECGLCFFPAAPLGLLRPHGPWAPGPEGLVQIGVGDLRDEYHQEYCG